LSKEKVAKAREKVLALLKVEGITLEDVFGGRAASGKTRRPAAVKYQNPADPSQTWTGRGKRPCWYDAAIKAARKRKICRSKHVRAVRYLDSLGIAS